MKTRIPVLFTALVLALPLPGLFAAEAALADLLLVDGDPLTNLALVADPGKNFVVIMKDGKIFKNTLR